MHHWLIQRNIFIAIAAIAQAVFIQVITHSAINFGLLYIAGISTWIAYEYYRCTLTKLHYALIVSVIGTTLYTTTALNFILLATTGGVAWLYTSNVIAVRNKSIVKNTVVSLCWISTNVIIQHTNFNYYLILQQFLFMLALTLIYDNKDVAIDTQNNTNTLAVSIGNKHNTLVALALLAISLGAMYVFTLYASLVVFIVFAMSCFVIFLYEMYVLNSSTNYYYYYAIDGLLVLQLITLINTTH
jgi:4-hydroxybenzoate polyprenyltransferase